MKTYREILETKVSPFAIYRGIDNKKLFKIKKYSGKPYKKGIPYEERLTIDGEKYTLYDWAETEKEAKGKAK